MFATNRRPQILADFGEFKSVRNHKRALKYLDARKYIKMMGDHLWECGALSKSVALDCVHNETAQESLHRCVGSNGAHPDLIAWDVAEFLNSNYRDMDGETW